VRNNTGANLFPGEEGIKRSVFDAINQWELERVVREIKG
jgi:hypothetical protein